MRLTVYLPDNLRLELKQAARDEGVSMSAFVAKAINAYLSSKRKKAGNRLLELIHRGSVSPDVYEKLEKHRIDDGERTS